MNQSIPRPSIHPKKYAKSRQIPIHLAKITVTCATEEEAIFFFLFLLKNPTAADHRLRHFRRIQSIAMFHRIHHRWLIRVEKPVISVRQFARVAFRDISFQKYGGCFIYSIVLKGGKFFSGIFFSI